MKDNNQKAEYKNGLCDVIAGRKDEEVKGVRYIDINGKDTFCSYSMILVESKCILNYMRKKGLKKGDKVILMVTQNDNFIPAFWACMCGGFTAVPLSFNGGSSDLERFLNVFKSLDEVFVLTDREIINNFKTSMQTDDFDKLNKKLLYSDAMRSALELCKCAAIDINDLAIIQFSSGTTGVAKGVLMTHHNILENISDLTQRIGSVPEDICLSWLPLTFDMGLIAFHILSLFMNQQQILMPTQDFLKSPEFWLKSVEKYRVEYLYCPNSALKLTKTKVEQNADFDVDLSSVKIVFCGGELVTPHTCDEFYQGMKKFGIESNTIMTVYGMAEATVGVATPLRGEAYQAVRVDTRSLKPGHAVEYCNDASAFALNIVDSGYPLDGIEVRIGDLSGNDLGEDRLGIIHLRGSYVTRGYINQENDEKFLKHGWFQTSDYGFFHNGRLVVVGRMDDVVIINGKNYYISDFERVLKETAGLEQISLTICRIRNEQKHTDDIAIFFLSSDGQNGNSDFEIAAKIRESISAYALINVDYIIPIEKIPVNKNGKVNGKELADNLSAGKYEGLIKKMERQAAEEAVTDKEQDADVGILLDIWENITGYRINGNDSLLAYGIDSIAANKFVSEIQISLNVDISITDLFYCKTMNEVYNLITERM